MPEQKGFQLFGAKKRRLAKASRMELVKNMQIAYHYDRMRDCHHWGVLVLKVTCWTIYHLVTLLTPLRLQKAESVCKLKPLILGEIVNYEFRTEKSITKCNLLWVMTEW